MIKFTPFKALLPNKKMADHIVTKPFDTYSKAEIEQIITTNPTSFLHVIVPVHNQFEKKNYSYEELLNLGKQKLEEYIQKEVFVSEKWPAYFVYRQITSKGTFTGFIGAASIDDYISGKIKKHEETLLHKEELLKQYLETVDIHAEPVFLIYPENQTLKSIIDSVCNSGPDYTVKAFANEEHQLWKVSDKDTIQQIKEEFEKMDSLYIADGHHRSAASSLYGKNKREEYPQFNGEEPFNFFMAAALSESEAKLYEFSRLVKCDEGFEKSKFLESVSKYFDITQQSERFVPSHIHEFGLYLDFSWYKLNLKALYMNSQDLHESLDPYLLNKFLFDPILGITDLRKDKRVSFIGGKCNPAQLEESVNSGKYKMAFNVFPVSMKQFKEIADAGIPMPPKSTYFEPKFPNALVIYPLQRE
jgi:uncharacterized protein (DUF1015 family)